MKDNERVLLDEKLRSLFYRRFMRLTECWEPSDWSKCYLAEFIGNDILYVKWTPRNRFEARTTSVLHSYCPDCIPEVLADDLIPASQWHWFLLEDAGKCNHDGISLENASKAAFNLGKLQNTIHLDTQIAHYLPQCRADNLQEAVMSVCGWVLQTVSAEMRDEILSLQEKVNSSTNYFRALQKTLAYLPSTCVHGDFWSGNIACREGKVSFIDWGDALWGVGSISFVNLLASANGELSNQAYEIWEAYFRGWEKDMREDIIRGSQVAANVGSLIVDVEIAKCCNGTIGMLPGLFPTLRILAKVLA